MDIQLRVTPEALKTKADDVSQLTAKLESQFNDILDTANRTSSYWVGIAGDTARLQFSAQQDDIETILKRFREHPTDLLNMAGVYEGAEKMALEENNKLDADVIE